MSLSDQGWDRYLSSMSKAMEGQEPGLEPGRIVTGGAALWRVACESDELMASVAGRLRHGARTPGDLPAAGDWVLVRRSGPGAGRIERILPRRSLLARRAAGRRGGAQIVAANVDRVLIVMGLDGDYNVRRLERYLAMVESSGARPAILLTKRDLCAGHVERTRETAEIAPGAGVLCVNGLDPGCAGEVATLVPAGETAALVGSSGAGKSTLVNLLLGRPARTTGAVRAGDDRGRHTTTLREIIRLPGGGLLLDNPGMREVGPAGDDASAGSVFGEIDALAAHCRYRDCRHEAEPGCAVLSAVEEGRLEEGRLRGYRAVLREQRYLEIRQDDAARRERTRRWRVVHKALRRDPRRWK